MNRRRGLMIPEFKVTVSARDSERRAVFPSVARVCGVLLLWMAILVPGGWFLDAEDVAPGRSRFCEQRRVEYIVGNLPVILSAPHGGGLAPSTIPDRKRGTLVTDAFTDRLAREIARAFYKQTGRFPHVIICHLKRTKVDCNRSLEEATEGDPAAQRVWNGFHGFIDDARKAVLKAEGRGLYIDLHGHGHPEARLELGYLIKSAELALNAKKLESLEARSSIRGLSSRSQTSFVERLRGRSSFGGLIQRLGYAAVPSPKFPHPGKAKYFRGGYNTARYGSRDGGAISGFQVECHRKGVRDTAANRKRFAQAFAAAVNEYLRIHCALDIRKKRREAGSGR